jgi:polygalacturonase
MINGSFSSEGIDGVKVYGRGIINCSNFGYHNNAGMINEGRTGALQLTSGKNITVDGITVFDPPMWAIVANYSDSVTIKNVNIFASVVNGDPIHFSAASNVVISGIFARACDDQLVAYHYGNTNIITIKNSVIWSDEGSCILLGLGSTGSISNIIAKDLAILNHKGVSADLDKYNGVMKIWPNGTTCSVSNVAFKNVRIDTVKTPASSAMFQIRTDKNFSGDANGKIAENISFENVSYAGVAGTLRNSLLQGVSSSSKINGVAFKNVVVGGTTVLSSGNAATYLTQTAPTYITNVTYSN